MKTLCTLLIALLSLQVSYTQVVAVTKKSDANLEMPSADESNAIVTTDIRAVKELSNKMKRFLQLPGRVMEHNVTGRVLLNVHVGEDGKINEIDVVESLGKDVDDSIVKALKRVKKVKPLVINGKKQARIIQMPVVIQ